MVNNQKKHDGRLWSPVNLKSHTIIRHVSVRPFCVRLLRLRKTQKTKNYSPQEDKEQRRLN